MRAVEASSRDQAIDVLVELLGEHFGALPAPEFYDRLCAAVCRLTRLERAVLLLYDHAYQAVRAMGVHGLDIEVARRLEGTLNETPIAQKALADDEVIVLADDFYAQVPERYQMVVDTEAVACIPVATGGRWLGVIFADVGGAKFSLDDGERLPLRTLGRAAALVASVEQATRERERARGLDARIALTREIHEQVMQRLFALSLVLGSEGDLSSEDRRRADSELRKVLVDLRGALERGLTPPERETKVTLDRVIERLMESDPRVELDWRDGLEVPAELEPLAQSVLSEAIRNVEKHAHAETIRITVDARDGALLVEVWNDGATGEATAGSGLGLRLATIEALRRGGVVEFGQLGGERWRTRLVCPVEAAAQG